MKWKIKALNAPLREARGIAGRRRSWRGIGRDAEECKGRKRQRKGRERKEEGG